MRTVNGVLGKHKGIDIISNDAKYPTRGAKIYSACSGKVYKSRTLEEGGYAGFSVTIECIDVDNNTDENIMMNFLHLDEMSPLRTGDSIEAGDFIGLIGNSTTMTVPMGVHLHFGVNIGRMDHGYILCVDSSKEKNDQVCINPYYYYYYWQNKIDLIGDVTLDVH